MGCRAVSWVVWSSAWGGGLLCPRVMTGTLGGNDTCTGSGRGLPLGCEEDELGLAGGGVIASSFLPLDGEGKGGGGEADGGELGCSEPVVVGGLFIFSIIVTPLLIYGEKRRG